MSLEDVLALVQGSLSALPPEEQEKARRLIAQQGDLTGTDTATDKQKRQDVGIAGSDASIKKAQKKGSAIAKGGENSQRKNPPSASNEALDGAGTDGTVANNNQPKKPLSAYNIFFQLERKRIIDICENFDGCSNEIDFTKRESYTVEDVAKFALQQRKEQLSNEPKPRRKHRKTHGKIGFADLARTIATNWKTMSAEERTIFQDYFEEEQARYRAELAKWAPTPGQSNKKTPSAATASSLAVEDSAYENNDAGILSDGRVGVARLMNNADDIESNANGIGSVVNPTAELDYQSMRSALKEEKAKQLAMLRLMKYEMAQQQQQIQQQRLQQNKQLFLLERQRELQIMNQLQKTNVPPLGAVKNDPAFLAGLKYGQMFGSQLSNPTAAFQNQFDDNLTMASMAKSHQGGMHQSYEQHLFDLDMNTINQEDIDDHTANPTHDIAERSFQNVYDTVNGGDSLFGADTASLSDFPANTPMNNEFMMKMMLMNQRGLNPMIGGVNNRTNQFGLPAQQLSSPLQNMLQRQSLEQQAAGIHRPPPMDEQRMMMLLRQRQLREQQEMLNRKMSMNIRTNKNTSEEYSLPEYQQMNLDGGVQVGSGGVPNDAIDDNDDPSPEEKV